MRCFFLAIHVTKRHLVLYIEVDKVQFFSFVAVTSAISSPAVKHICKRRTVSVFGKQAHTTRTTVIDCAFPNSRMSFTVFHGPRILAD